MGAMIRSHVYEKILFTTAMILLVSLSACTTGARRDAGLVAGGVVGGIAGNALTGGSAAGIIVGAVGGAYVGRQVSH